MRIIRIFHGGVHCSCTTFMKKDILLRKVEQLVVAIVPRLPHEEDFESFWDAYLINLRSAPILSVLVNSYGYGILDGESRKTSSLRYFFEEVPAMNAVKIEPMYEPVLAFTNEFWVSFSFEDYLYDKQYIFVPGSLSEINFTEIPILQRKGVMIR